MMHDGQRIMLCGMALWLGSLSAVLAQQPAADLKNLDSYVVSKAKVRPLDWPQWGGTSLRNNTPSGKNIPTDWRVPDNENDRGKNIKWSAHLGSTTYSSPVVANGKVFIGTNNTGYVSRFPLKMDLGCLLCLDEETGRFLWQHSNTKLPSGRVNLLSILYPRFFAEDSLRGDHAADSKAGPE